MEGTLKAFALGAECGYGGSVRDGSHYEGHTLGQVAGGNRPTAQARCCCPAYPPHDPTGPLSHLHACERHGTLLCLLAVRGSLGQLHLQPAGSACGVSSATPSSAAPQSPPLAVTLHYISMAVTLSISLCCPLGGEGIPLPPIWKRVIKQPRPVHHGAFQGGGGLPLPPYLTKCGQAAQTRPPWRLLGGWVTHPPPCLAMGDLDQSYAAGFLFAMLLWWGCLMHQGGEPPFWLTRKWLAVQ